MSETRIEGRCICGEGVTKILNSEKPTMWRNGTRWIYSGRPDLGWCIFRCDKCGAVIDETFTEREN
jgi:hypothetical protein